MASEAVIIELLGKVPGCPIRYTCATGTAITKGAVMTVTDPRTCVAHTGIDQPIVGIAAAGKTATDTTTTIALYTNGIFDMTAAALGVTVTGARCAGSATANMFTAADAADLIQGSDIGYLLEDAANDEVAAVRVLK